LSFLVFSEEHGVAKPDPRLFALALREAGCSPHECLHVGDLPAADVAGARAAGLRSAWLRRGEAPPVAEPEPDLTIDHLTELVDLLGPGR
jgi:FMN phosphatase YigB (HAD superfamily)